MPEGIEGNGSHVSENSGWAIGIYLFQCPVLELVTNIRATGLANHVLH